ncbi:FAD-dependent oxidoreductase [Thermosulfuriphilus sp.]
MAEGKILVIGGGISGITAAVEAAEVGYDVVLVEKAPYLGGRVAQLNYYFPKLCPPTCGLEINFRRIKENPRISFYTMAEVKSISGGGGNYNVSLSIAPRMVNDNCTACGACVEACPVERESDFDFGLGKTKAIYLPYPMAFPLYYVIDKAACKGKDCGKCIEACNYQAIDLDMGPQSVDLTVDSIIVATGWKPYDATKMDNLGYGRFANVIINMQMERMASPNGPTGGKILRPSDNQPPKKVAFVQCAGSRDENHLPYCSYICCLASLKQSIYLREQYEDSEAYIFYIDLRTPGRYEKFLNRVQADEKVHFIKGKVAKIEEDPQTKDLIVTAEDTATGKKHQETVNMVVLAVGMQPSIEGVGLPGDVPVDQYGFVLPDEGKGIYACGCARMPLDVMSSNEQATGAALKAIQTIVRR